jgi:hypothetical protein
MNAKTAILVEAVKTHAAANYENGWDVVVEAMTDDEIAGEIGAARTQKGAIARVQTLVNIRREHMIDVLGASGEHEAEVAALVEAAKKPRRVAATKQPAKPAAKPAAAKRTVTAKLSTDQDAIPSDDAALRKLIKITADRRWRAGRREDTALVAEMDARLIVLRAALEQRQH